MRMPLADHYFELLLCVPKNTTLNSCYARKKSVIANRVYSRFSVSVQRSIANNIMEFRYGQVPAQLVVGAGA